MVDPTPVLIHTTPEELAAFGYDDLPLEAASLFGLETQALTALCRVERMPEGWDALVFVGLHQMVGLLVRLAREDESLFVTGYAPVRTVTIATDAVTFTIGQDRSLAPVPVRVHPDGEGLVAAVRRALVEIVNPGLADPILVEPLEARESPVMLFDDPFMNEDLLREALRVLCVDVLAGLSPERTVTIGLRCAITRDFDGLYDRGQERAAVLWVPDPGTRNGITSLDTPLKDAAKRLVTRFVPRKMSWKRTGKCWAHRSGWSLAPTHETIELSRPSSALEHASMMHYLSLAYSTSERRRDGAPVVDVERLVDAIRGAPRS